MIHKVFRHISQLSLLEFQRFSQFVRSPYHVKHAETVALFEITAPAYPDYARALPGPEALYSQIYPGQPFDDSRLRTLRKYLFQAYLRFLALEKMPSDDAQWLVWEAEALYESGALEEFDRHKKKAREALAISPTLSEDHFLAGYCLARAELTRDMAHASRVEPKLFEPLLNELTAFFLAEYLKYACTAVYLARATAIPAVELPMLEAAVAYCERNPDQLPRVVQLYHGVYRLLSGPFEEGLFNQVKTDLLRHASRLTAYDQKTLFNHLVNLANQQYRGGNLHMLEEMLALYQSMLALGLLLDKGALSSHHYKNLVTLALRLGHFDWAEKFIQSYKKMLPPEVAEGVYCYNLAHLCFYRQEYRQSLRLLQQVTFIDPYYRISYNLLLFKIYYACDETEPLLSLVLAFRNYLARQKELSRQQRAAYLNFIRFTRGLYAAKRGKWQRISALSRQIESCTALIEKEWLLSMILELQKRR